MNSLASSRNPLIPGIFADYITTA